MKILTALSLLILLVTPLAAATEVHPFAISEPAQGLDLSFGRLEWGRTSLSYSQAWSEAGSFSQGLLLKELCAPLTSQLDFRAQFGLAFTPGTGPDGEPRQPELVIPYAALNWEPSDHFQLRLEYSHFGSTGSHPFGALGREYPWYSRSGWLHP